jgi:hypothetical protein
MNNKQKQQIKVSSFLVLCVCFSSLLVFLSGRHETHKGEDITEKAFKRMDLHAAKLIETKFLTPQAGLSSRSLASVQNGSETVSEKLDGKVGLDPWGYPFHYFIKKDALNPNKGKLILWSKGEDHKLDTSLENIMDDHTIFKGDDFGKTVEYSL